MYFIEELTHQNLGISTTPLTTLVSGSALKRTVVGGDWCVTHEKTKAAVTYSLALEKRG